VVNHILGLQVPTISIGIILLTTLIFFIISILIQTKAAEASTAKKASGQPVDIKNEAASLDIPMPEEIDDEVIAVIAAAVSCITNGTMRIKTITRIKENSVPAWSFAGRQETMNLRQI
jgi:hypothetical protein